MRCGRMLSPMQCKFNKRFIGFTCDDGLQITSPHMHGRTHARMHVSQQTEAPRHGTYENWFWFTLVVPFMPPRLSAAQCVCMCVCPRPCVIVLILASRFPQLNRVSTRILSSITCSVYASVSAAESSFVVRSGRVFVLSERVTVAIFRCSTIGSVNIQFRPYFFCFILLP